MKVKTDMQGINIIHTLKEINISAFLDKLGPAHVLHVFDPGANMQGILVVDNTTLGPGCGGIRIDPSITPYETFLRARNMTWACALSDVALGGGAAAIKADPRKHNKEKQIRSFARKISPFVPERFIGAPDVHVGMEEMEAFAHEVKDRRGATGKSESNGGITYESGIFGLAMGVAVETCLETAESSPGLPKELAGAKIAIQGFDDTGLTLARYLQDKGARLVGLSDRNCALWDPKGMDLDEVLKCSAGQNGTRSFKRCKRFDKLPKEEIIDVDCDIFILTTGGRVITGENVRGVRAGCVVEGINDPVTSVAEQTLYKKGCLVIPDIIPRMAGAIGSYLEYSFKGQEIAFSQIDSKLREVTREGVEQCLTSGIPLRTVLEEMARQKIQYKQEVI